MTAKRSRKKESLRVGDPRRGKRPARQLKDLPRISMAQPFGMEFVSDISKEHPQTIFLLSPSYLCPNLSHHRG
jgi:hypothetical protein